MSHGVQLSGNEMLSLATKPRPQKLVNFIDRLTAR